MQRNTPPHPGSFVRSEIIEPHGLTVAAAAEVLGVSRPTLSTMLNGHSSLSIPTPKAFSRRSAMVLDTLGRKRCRRKSSSPAAWFPWP